MIHSPPSSLSPARRLGLAVTLSVIAHLALITALARPASEAGLTGPAQPRLVARLVTRPAQARAAAQPQPQPLPRLPVPRPPLPETPPTPPLPIPPPPDAGTPAATPPDIRIPDTYHPLASLTREPELVTPLSPETWPSLPGSPTGSFQLELAIGADGTVDLVVPHCDEALCPAARIYGDIVSQWHFQPAEILGRPAPSRLRLEFEVGIAPDGGEAVPPQPPLQ